MEFALTIEFTDAVRAAIAPRSPPTFQTAPAPTHSPLVAMQPGDAVRIQGIPTSVPLHLVGKLWTLTQDQLTLVLMLGTGDGPQMAQ